MPFLQLRHVAVCDGGAACTHTGSKILETKAALDKAGSSEVVVKYRLSGHCSCSSVFVRAVETYVSRNHAQRVLVLSAIALPVPLGRCESFKL